VNPLIPFYYLHKRLALFHRLRGRRSVLLVGKIDFSFFVELVLIFEAIFRVVKKYSWQGFWLPKCGRQNQGYLWIVRFVNRPWYSAFSPSQHFVNHIINIVIIFNFSLWSYFEKLSFIYLFMRNCHLLTFYNSSITPNRFNRPVF